MSRRHSEKSKAFYMNYCFVNKTADFQANKLCCRPNSQLSKQKTKTFHATKLQVNYSSFTFSKQPV